MFSDQALIIQFQQSINKEVVFTQLLRKHQQKVYYQIKRMILEPADADDIAQLVWIKVWNKLDGFKMESAFSTWIFRIAYNETLNYIQNKKKQSSHISNDDLFVYENASGSADEPTPTKIEIALESAIKQLPEKQRIVFMLRYFDGYEYDKIAGIMGTTVGGAKANFHQAVKKIERFVKKL